MIRTRIIIRIIIIKLRRNHSNHTYVRIATPIIVVLSLSYYDDKIRTR